MELMPNDERSFIESWRAELARCKSNGPIAIWGAGAKGVTFANAIDPNCDTASCVLDINPAKHNKFIPVTAHPVLSADAVSKQRIGTIVIMNPNYKAEIEAHLRRVSASVALMQA